MSKLVLYRKYRPGNFSDIIGQDHIVKTLQNAIKNDNISHAYLFCGPRGTGKTSMARLLAKAVNCEDKSSPEPCNKCNSCKSIIDGNAVDLIEIDAASHRGIDEIRELREGVRFSPNYLRYKVYIIDESHQLTLGAVNALLKTLEEAPEHVIFILATTEAHKMIPTIVSRCQRFDFRKLNLSEIVEKLERILKKEKIKSDKKALELIATSSGGSFRDAESLLGQILTFTEKKIDEKDVRDLLGILETEYIAEFVDLLIKKEKLKAFDYLENLYQRGVEMERFQKAVVEYLRQILILNISEAGLGDEESSVISSLKVSFTETEMKKLKEQSEKMKAKRITRMIRLFLRAGKQMDYSPIIQLPLELAIVRITA